MLDVLDYFIQRSLRASQFSFTIQFDNYLVKNGQYKYIVFYYANYLIEYSFDCL
jgi:hypothetical protein